MTRTILFDLDGTLVDSVPDLTAALNRVLRARGIAPFDEATVTGFVGDGVRALVERAFAARGLAADEDAVAAYTQDYTAHASEATRPYPGVPDTLAVLRDAGWLLAVCTNKPEAAARSVLGDLGLGRCFAAIGGGDSFLTRKPDPGHLLETLRAAGGERERALMVGDHRNDVRAAAGAGLPAIFAAWGYSPRASAEGAAAIAERFTDLPRAAEALLPG